MRVILDTFEKYMKLFAELKSMPFYKVDNGYRYGGKLLTNAEKVPATVVFLTDRTLYDDEELNTLFDSFIDSLKQIFISDEVFDKYTTTHQPVGEVAHYKDLIKSTSQKLFQIIMKYNLKNLKTRDSDDVEDALLFEDAGYRKSVADSKVLSTDKLGSMLIYSLINNKTNSKTSSDQPVLNHRNPFADISIKEQTFIYGSTYGQFESLKMVTSHILTKNETNENSGFIEMKPGFKIVKEHGESLNDQNPRVSFDDTLSSAIAEENDECYVYIT